MKAMKFDGANHVLKLEGGTEENDLPCKIEDGWTISRWQMTDEDREKILGNGLLMVWIWWPNLIGVRLGLWGEELHTEETMHFPGPVTDDKGIVSLPLIATLNERELDLIREAPPRDIELRVDMHPTCPVGVGPVEYES